MEQILNFFWLFCGAWVGIGNAIFFRLRLRAAVREEAISQDEVDRFTLGFIGWISGPCILLWLVQVVLADAVSPDFLTWEVPYAVVGTVICVVLWIVAFTWIWMRGGDRRLARIYTLARYQTFIWGHPTAFRLGIVLVIAGGVIGLLIPHRIERPLK